MVYSFYTYFKHPVDTKRLPIYMHGASTRTKVTTTENTMHITAVPTAELFTFQKDHKCWAIETHGRSPRTRPMHVKSHLHLLPPYTTHSSPQCNHTTRTS